MKVLIDRFRFGDIDATPATLVAVRTLEKSEVAALFASKDLTIALGDERVAQRIAEVFNVNYPTIRPKLRLGRGDILFVIEPREKGEATGLTVFEVVVQ